VVVGVHLPLVVPLLLLAWLEIAVRLPIQSLGVGVFLDLGTSLGVNHVLGILESCGGDSEGNLAILSLFRPVVAPRIPLAQRFSLLGGILVLLDVVEFVGQSAEVLGLDHVLHVLGAISALSVAVGGREFRFVVGQSPVLLDFARLVDMGLSVFAQMGRRVSSGVVHVLPDVEVGILSLPDSHNLEAGSSYFGEWVLPDSDTLLQSLA
jgi:hypothetical protein